MNGFKRPILGQFYNQDKFKELFVLVTNLRIDGSSLGALANSFDREAIAVSGKGVCVFCAAWS